MQLGGFKAPHHRARLLSARAGIALLITVTNGTASAQDRLLGQVGGSVAITTDYVYRGVSLSRGRVAYQGGVHIQLPRQWQVGVWGSTFENRDHVGAPLEATAFLAHTWTLTPDWNVRAGVMHYQYFSQSTPVDYDHDEIFVSVSFQSQLTMGLSWMPNVVRYRYRQPTQRAAATAIDVTWSQPLVRDWSATIGVGYYDLSSLYGTGYAYGHVGVSGAMGPIEVDLLHIDSDAHAADIYGEAVTGRRWSATARWRF